MHVLGLLCFVKVASVSNRYLQNEGVGSGCLILNVRSQVSFGLCRTTGSVGIHRCIITRYLHLLVLTDSQEIPIYTYTMNPKTKVTRALSV